MDKNTWLDLDKASRAAHLKILLSQIVCLDRAEKKDVKPIKVASAKYKLEQEVLNLIEFEKEEHAD